MHFSCHEEIYECLKSSVMKHSQSAELDRPKCRANPYPRKSVLQYYRPKIQMNPAITELAVVENAGLFAHKGLFDPAVVENLQ